LCFLGNGGFAKTPAVNIPRDLLASATCLGTIRSACKLRALSPADVSGFLASPIGPAGATPAVFDLVRPGESVCFVVSDHTRRTAADLVFPLLLDGLTRKGCSPADMRILVASGIHRRPTQDELAGILGPKVFREFDGRIFLHDPDNEAELVDVGTTPRGHRVRVNRRAVKADRLILLGAATYHYHAGFGGGRKSLVPGVAARETIAHTHSLTLDPTADRIHPNVGPGILDGNPVSEEMLAGARLCDPDCIVNTVLAPDGTLVAAFSGDLDAAHRAACRKVEEVSRVNLAEPADLVIASAGPATNWIQSHKAFFNAHRAVKPGGCVVLLAPCPEGLGDERFREWVRRPDLATIFRELRRAPEVLGQTAVSTRSRAPDTILVTKMSGKDAADLRMRTAPDLDAAARMALDLLRSRGCAKPTCYLFPEAGSLVPFVSAPDAA
jgi:nickel-dependent lactate racemase